MQFDIKISQVACALLMAGENLEKHTDVQDILVQMGIYFQVQVNFDTITPNFVLLLQKISEFPPKRKKSLIITLSKWNTECNRVGQKFETT